MIYNKYNKRDMYFSVVQLFFSVFQNSTMTASCLDYYTIIVPCRETRVVKETGDQRESRAIRDLR